MMTFARRGLSLVRPMLRHLMSLVVGVRELGVRGMVRKVLALRWHDVIDGVGRIDIRRPVHAILIGVILAGIVAPVADKLITNERYRLAEPIRAITETPSPNFGDKLRYSTDQKAHVFNAEGKHVTASSMKDALAGSVGAGGKKDNQLYTATLPDDPAKGIEVVDNVNDLSVKFVPKIALLEGRGTDGHVVYPLKEASGRMVFTPKANGLKEDVVLDHAPATDEMDIAYELVMPKSVEARLDEDGSIGFYTATPELFGNVTFGTDKDREAVEKARIASIKEYLMFKIPAPVIRETGSVSKISAKFVLHGTRMVVRTTGLRQAHYPLSIDPTFLLTTTTDFVLGSIDDNIDLSVANQVGRQALVGGSTPDWTPNSAPSLTYAQFASSLVAYNGYLYLIGGGSGNGSSGTTTNDVRYICLNPTTGALGTNGGCTPAAWTGTSTLQTARQGLQSFGFNGYLYAVGGEDNSGNPITTASAHTTEYAKINSDGTVGTWAYTSNLNTQRSYPAGAIYQGVLYIMGGTSGNNNTTFLSTSEYARINGDGTIGTWTQSSSAATGNLTAARSRFRGAASNGYIYIAGGQTSSSTVVNTVEYAPIQSNGSIGAWVATTSFTTARRDPGVLINNGYLYVFAGCQAAAQACSGFIADTQYAVINADGTVGQWQSTVPYNTGGFNARMPAGVTAYSNHVYFVGGCSTETATNNCGTQLVGTFISSIDPVGRYDRGILGVQTTVPYNNNAATVARMGAQAVALNGYLYLIGGCSATNCNSATSYSSTVEVAALSSNGSLGTFSTTSALITTDTTNNNAGRHGIAVAAYNNKVYVIAGLDRTKANADSFRSEILSASQNSDGTLNTWAAETNTLPAARAFGTAVVWRNYIFYVGGLSNATTASATIYRAQITSNAPGTWSATTTGLTNARWGHSTGLWGNWLYAVGGQSDVAGTYITAANGTEQLTITNSGDITAAASVQNVTGATRTRLSGGFVYNGYIYTFGGYVSGSTTQVATIAWSRLDPSTGALGNWSTTNIGNNAATFGLATARGMTTAVAASGYFYVLGGCANTLAANSFASCGTFVTTTNTTEVNLPNNGGTGQTNSFASATALGTATADHATVAYNGYLYKVGGCTGYTTGACTNGSNVTTVEAAPIAPDANSPGVLGAWTTTGMTALPSGRSLLSLAAYSGYIYAIAGRDNTGAATATVYYAPISSTGTIGAWSNADLPSGAERWAAGAAVSNGYIYVAGGDNGSGTKKSDVYYASIDTSTGALGTWNTTSSFTTARSNHNVIAYNGRLYVIGGSDGTNTLTDIQFAVQASNGTLGSFSYTTEVSRGMNFRQAQAANGYMYFFGNEGDTTEVHYVNINANGTLGTDMMSVAVMGGAHAHGAVSWYNGHFYLTGGCTLSSGTCSTPSTSTEYVGQQVISRVGHYSKLYNTVVDTSPTNVLINGSIGGPGSAVEFKLQTSSSTDTVLGVAQLLRPVIFGNTYSVQALNSSGTNVGVAINYLFLVTVDDARSGTFPDVVNSGGGFSQTSVTDITMFYHASPKRRLRHGASFTDTGCNPTTPGECLLDTAP